MNKILIPHGKLKVIAEKVGCSTTYAKQCLRGAFDTDLAKEVRKTALTKFIGGVQVPKTSNK